MEQFITRHRDRIVGVLHGWDRLLFRGTLRSISYVNGMSAFLGARGILLKDFASFCQRCTDAIETYAKAIARRAGRPYEYLASSSVSKEERARQIAQEQGVTEGLICVLACVEPCMSFDIHRNRQTKHLDLVSRQRKCRFFYFYFMHRDFGLMHVRLQSWLPLEVQVCMNGRSYLQRRLDKAGIGYEKRDNCFAQIDDVARAQAMMNDLTSRQWAVTLNQIVSPLMPLLQRGGLLSDQRGYYWTLRQSEYATDVMFEDDAALKAVYPALCRHAIEALTCDDVLKFLGKRPSMFRGQVTSDQQRRSEGVRVKHRVNTNGIKMYDKQGSVLRIETTINDPSMFRVLRQAEGKKDEPATWRRMRKGVADIARRREVSRAANERYLAALAVVNEATPVAATLDAVSRPVRHAGHSVRGLRPISEEDAALFAVILRGEHLIDGFTNRLLQRGLFAAPARDEVERRRRCSHVSRQLRLLRRHGLIRKISRRRLYRITARGHRVMTLATAIRSCNRADLSAAA